MVVCPLGRAMNVCYGDIALIYFLGNNTHIQNEQLEQVDTFPYIGSRITEDGIPYQVKRRAGDRGITAENIEKSQHADFNEDTANESASVACSNVCL